MSPNNYNMMASYPRTHRQNERQSHDFPKAHPEVQIVHGAGTIKSQKRLFMTSRRFDTIAPRDIDESLTERDSNPLHISTLSSPKTNNLLSSNTQFRTMNVHHSMALVEHNTTSEEDLTVENRISNFELNMKKTDAKIVNSKVGLNK